MKLHSFFLLMAVLFTSALLAQTSYEGPAKKPYDDFWKIVNELKAAYKANPEEIISNNKLTSAGSKLSMAKIKDKELNTAAMETELKELEELMRLQIQGKRDKYNASVKSDMMLDELLKSGAPIMKHTGNRDADITAYKEAMQQFAKSVDDYFAGNPDKTKFGSRENTINTRAAQVKMLTERMESQFSTAKDEAGLYAYYELQGMQLYWEKMKKFFPSSAAVSGAAATINEALGKAGSEAQVLAKFKQNKAEALKNAKMPPAVVKDAVTENLVISFFGKSATLEGYTPAKVNLMNTDWVIDRNNLTGIIIQRTKMAVVGAKRRDGTCWLLRVWISQDYTGSGYGNSKHNGDNIISETACGNIQ